MLIGLFSFPNGFAILNGAKLWFVKSVSKATLNVFFSVYSRVFF